MMKQDLLDCLCRTPVVAAVQEGALEAAIASPAEVIFHLKSNVLTLPAQIAAVHAAGKHILVHLDLAEGIGRDRAGLAYLAELGVDGVITTRTQLVRQAKEMGLIAVQRFFALDSQGLESAAEALANTAADLIEIMPGVIGKVIARFAAGDIPVIAGGLIETKKEVVTALECGAFAVSTSKSSLWNLD
ncbi:MAG: glycerol-3-phosphate responsive antiterminator [Clostridia bacterium]|nr:glycerol-3-phosphate responsive antiterminator [Clostridia bacterium]